jgi:hypothetical protein
VIAHALEIRSFSNVGIQQDTTVVLTVAPTNIVHTYKMCGYGLFMRRMGALKAVSYIYLQSICKYCGRGIGCQVRELCETLLYSADRSLQNLPPPRVGNMYSTPWFPRCVWILPLCAGLNSFTHWGFIFSPLHSHTGSSYIYHLPLYIYSHFFTFTHWGFIYCHLLLHTGASHIPIYLYTLWIHRFPFTFTH